MYTLKKFFTDTKETLHFEEAKGWVTNGERVFAFLTDSRGCTVKTAKLIYIDDHQISDFARTYPYNGLQVNATKVCLVTFYDDTAKKSIGSFDIAHALIERGHEVVAFFIRADQINWEDMDSAWRTVSRAATYRSSPISSIDEKNRTFQTKSGSLYDFS